MENSTVHYAITRATVKYIWLYLCYIYYTTNMDAFTDCYDLAVYKQPKLRLKKGFCRNSWQNNILEY